MIHYHQVLSHSHAIRFSHIFSTLPFDIPIPAGNEPYYMLSNYASFLSSTREECCLKFYSWNYDSCAGITPATSNKFYPDWITNTFTCLNDGNMPKYMLVPENTDWYLSETKANCCDRFYSSAKERCMGNVPDEGAIASSEEVNEWYVKYDIMTCVQNSDDSAEAWDHLFDTKQACCHDRLWYAEESCLQT